METLSQLIERLKLIASDTEIAFNHEKPLMTKNGYSYVCVYQNEYTTFDEKGWCEIWEECYIVRGK